MNLPKRLGLSLRSVFRLGVTESLEERVGGHDLQRHLGACMAWRAHDMCVAFGGSMWRVHGVCVAARETLEMPSAS